MNAPAAALAIRRQIAAKPDLIKPLPQVVVDALMVLDDDQSTVQRLTNTLEQDASLSGRLLGLANMASERLTCATEISTIRMAISVLGFSRVRMLVTTLALKDSVIATAPGSNKAAFWDHCLNVASAARVIAEHTHLIPDLCYVAGLVHDIGYLWLMVAHPEDMARISQSLEHSSLSVVEAEREIFGLDHGEIGELICQDWGLPLDTSLAVRGHHEPDALIPLNQYVMAVHLAEMLCQSLSLDNSQPNRINSMSDQVFSALGIEESELEDLLGEISARARYLRALVGINKN